jgi:osmotically-inducible protein OsmY
MMTRTDMKDSDLRQLVIEELEYEPSIDAKHIGVAVADGIVDLTGHVPTYAQRTTTEKIVSRIKGVRGIAVEIEVRPLGTHMTADDEIARRAADLLRWNASVPADKVRVKVAKGFVTLEGEVTWNYQRNAADAAVRGMLGVTGISNRITIKPTASPSDIRQRIEAALKRDAELDAAAIRVKVLDGTVTLEGRVDSFADRQLVERAAWAAPGVHKVDDRLSVS